MYEQTIRAPWQARPRAPAHRVSARYEDGGDGVTSAVLILGAGLVLLGIILLARYLDARAWRRSLLAIELHVPYGLTPGDIARHLNTVAAATHPGRVGFFTAGPVALEVVADHEGIKFFLLAPKSLRLTVLAGLRAALPGVRLTELADYFDTRPRCAWGVEAAQTNERRQTAVDRAEATATAVLATLQPVAPGEHIIVQWIITGAGTPTPVPSMTAQHRNELPAWLAGEELTDGEAIRSARTKQDAAMMLHASLRVGVQTDNPRRASAILRRVFDQHRGQNRPGVQIVTRWWLGKHWVADRLTDLVVPITGYPLRLASNEAAGLLPIPVGEVALPGVALGLARQLPPPPGLPESGVQVGLSNYPDMPVPLRLTDVDRMAHVHILGPTGVGKSTLLANIILQDIAAGHGVVVIDPKSDLVASILDRVPEHRVQDVIVADAAATEPAVIGFNILGAAHDEQSRELVVDHVIHIWHELYEDFWGPRSEDVLRGALLSLINTKAANGEAFTLIETADLLTSAPLRKFVTEQDGVPPALESFWAWYRGMLPADRLKVIGPILNKLRAATLRTPIRLMLGQAEGIDLSRVLAERRVLLVPLSAGTLGNETAALLGTVVLATAWQSILGRVALPASERHQIFVYIDEAQSVLKLPVDLADMLATARGYGVSFTLAHQHLGQIVDKQVKSALLGTIRSQIVFQLMRSDAEELAKSYEPRLTADDLMGAAQFEFAARFLVDGQTLAPMTGTTVPLPPPTRDGAALAEASRQQLGRPRSEVEAALKARSKPPEHDEPKPTAEGGKAKPAKGQPFGRRRKTDKPEGGAS